MAKNNMISSFRNTKKEDMLFGKFLRPLHTVMFFILFSILFYNNYINGLLLFQITYMIFFSTPWNCARKGHRQAPIQHQNLFVQTMIVLQRVMQFDSTKVDLAFNNIHNNYYYYKFNIVHITNYV